MRSLLQRGFVRRRGTGPWRRPTKAPATRILRRIEGPAHRLSVATVFGAGRNRVSPLRTTSAPLPGFRVRLAPARRAWRSDAGSGAAHHSHDPAPRRGTPRPAACRGEPGRIRAALAALRRDARRGHRPLARRRRRRPGTPVGRRRPAQRTASTLVPDAALRPAKNSTRSRNSRGEINSLKPSGIAESPLRRSRMSDFRTVTGP